jgi:hypothetical protein
MRIIRPATINALNLLSSNVTDAAPAEYNAGTTYADGDIRGVAAGTVVTVYESLQNGNTGNTPASSPLWWNELSTTYTTYNGGTTYGLDDIVISTTTNHEYQSLQAGNVGHSLADAAWWLDLGPTNRYRMFDQSNTSVTTREESIEVEVQISGRADAVSLLNILGATAQVIMETVTDGEIYNETFNLVSDSGIDNWYEYFFEPVGRKGDLTIYDLPLNADPKITVILNEPGDMTSIGTLVIGQSRDIGTLIHSSSFGIQDFSRKVQDDFGNFTIVERPFAKRANFRILMDEDAVDAIAAILASYRATPVVWVGVDSYTSTWVYGWARDWKIDFANPNETYLTLELEGLT